MHKFSFAFAALLTAVAGSVASAHNVEFSSVLNGAQEVPSVLTSATGTGTAILTGHSGSYVLTYSVNYTGLQSPIARPFAHIHIAPAGANGPIVHDLDGANVAPIAGSTSGVIIGDWRFDDASRPLTDSLADSLLANNGYFNIHTTANAGGEIRGQLIVVIPEPSAAFGILPATALLARRRRA